MNNAYNYSYIYLNFTLVLKEKRKLLVCTFLWGNKLIVLGLMKSLLNICNNNCKHCSSNSSWQNVHLNFMNLLLNQLCATLIAYGFSLSPPLWVSYKLSDFDASMFPQYSQPFLVQSLFTLKPSFFLILMYLMYIISISLWNYLNKEYILTVLRKFLSIFQISL